MKRIQCIKCKQLLLIMPSRSEKALWAYFIQHESSPRAALCRKGWQGVGWATRAGDNIWAPLARLFPGKG